MQLLYEIWSTDQKVSAGKKLEKLTIDGIFLVTEGTSLQVKQIIFQKNRMSQNGTKRGRKMEKALPRLNKDSYSKERALFENMSHKNTRRKAYQVFNAT